jgi:hypothetical protein
MPKARKPVRTMIQVRLTAAQRRRIKSLAANQDMTLQQAIVLAFEAWAEKLRADRRNPSPAPFPGSAPSADPLPPQPPPAWLKQVLQLDWTKCPEVELTDDGVNHLWMIRDSEAPLNVVLRAVADGIPAAEIAEVFELELSRLAKVLEFAATPLMADALN